MIRWLILILLLFPGFAQAAETVLHNAATANADGQNISVADKGSVGLTVTISGTATVTFKGSADGGSTWTAMNCIALGSTTNVTSTTSSAQYQCAVGGLTHIQAPISGCSGCTVTVRANSSIASRNIGSSSGGLASTDIDTCAEIAAIVSGETGTCGELVLSQGPTLADLVVTGSLNVPNGAAPTTDAFGEVAGDNNAWAAGRGALQFFDGTANTYIIGALVSDAPANGECIKWNTGGTITWETCGSGSMATDTLWDAAGDLAYGTGSNTGGRLAIGTANQLLRVNAGATAPEWTSTLTGLTSISFGADPGDGSPLNLSNNTCINWEIATPGTDKCLKVNASDQLDFNGTLNLSGAATGSVVINGVTSGSFTITGADAMAQSVTATVAAQTSGATVLTIPDMAGVNDTFMFAAKAVTKTNLTLDAEGTGNVITIPRRIWLPAAGCNNATAGSIWDLPTSNAPAAACITGTNTQKGVLDFDATTDESAQITYLLPSTFTGNIDARIYWLAAATTGSVGWCVQLVSTADAETDDPAFPAQGAGNCVSDAAKGTTLQVNSASITSVTATGVAASELLHIQISRDANGGAVTDDMTGDARLIGVELVIREAM